MPRDANLSEHVLRAFMSLSAEDQANIKLDLAQEVVKTAFDKLRRVRDRGLVTRYALAELCIGNQGPREKRQRTFKAYWRLTRRVLGNRESRARPIRRKKKEGA
ncbi:hypothetical protein A3A39_02765 [Candidatus Kaiserbacteria bacterium RIFCSPLOWO2_01_FULL_54_13]|uniref:Uncharacterized protein n=1 Tax=Candidatus Kaiserbacteria bacterium RIFCSPLOWO2_01_FULL_54_13 TaxID=1798512 RepID=A0A1F6F2I9_9BACT|nr:MAG: hypothetical protein A3A39_02765 [Candidatus Kaiserbacteria bacterium RIFCSPLOWO2_01_FULL_54_13]